MFDEKAFPPSEVNIGQLVADLVRKENRACLDERFMTTQWYHKMASSHSSRRWKQPIESCDLVVLKLKEDLPLSRAYPPKQVCPMDPTLSLASCCIFII